MAIVAPRLTLPALSLGALLAASCQVVTTRPVQVSAAVPSVQTLELSLSPRTADGSVAVEATWIFDGRLVTPLAVDFGGRHEAGGRMVVAFDGEGRELIVEPTATGLVVPQNHGSNRVTFTLDVAPTDGLLSPEREEKVVAMLAGFGSNNAWLPTPVGTERVRVDTRIELPADWSGAAPGVAQTVDTWSTTTPIALKDLAIVAGAFERVDDGSHPRLTVHCAAGASSDARAAAARHASDFAALERVLGEARWPVTLVYTLGLVGDRSAPAVTAAPGAIVVPLEWLGATGATADRHATAIASGLAAQWIGTSSEQRSSFEFWRGVAAHTVDWVVGTTTDTEVRVRHLDAARASAANGGSFERGYVTAHLARLHVGDGPYVHALRNRAPAGSIDDWISALEKASGEELAHVIAPWAKGRGVPVLDLTWRWQPVALVVELTVRQRQTPTDGVARVFKGPVDVEIVAGRRIVRHRIDLSERDQTFQLPCEAEPTWTRFDASQRLPHELLSRPDRNGVLARANRAESAVDRVDALREVGRLALESAAGPTRQMFVTQLSDAVVRDSSPWVREVAADRLAAVAGLEARATLERCVRQESSVAVAVQCLFGLRRWAPDPALARLADEIFSKSQDTSVRIAAAQLYAAADPARAASWLSDRLDLDSPHDLLRAALLDLWSRGDAPSIDETLVGWATDPLVADSVRRVALARLVERARPDRSEPRGLVDVLAHSDPRWRRPAIEALGRYQSRSARSALAAFALEATSRPEAGLAEAALRRR